MYTSPFFKKEEKEFPEVKEKNEGKFTAWAKKNGFKDACSAASTFFPLLLELLRCLVGHI